MTPQPPATRRRGLRGRSRGSVVVAVVLGASLAGCGGHAQRSAVPLYPVAGKVTLDGAPLAGAVVEFLPEGETRGQGASGPTGADGSYTLSTPFGEPGVTSGRYRVTIRKLVNASPPDPSDPAPPPIESAGRDALPPTYSDPGRSTLSAVVAPGDNPHVDLALKSARRARAR